MSELRNCAKCGRLFAYQGRNLCRRCLEEEENEYMVVRKYVRDHPGATVFEVAEETGVEEEKILQFLRDGRLQSKGLTALLKCERCGQPINSGHYCDKCLNEMNSQFKQVLKSDKQKELESYDSIRNREKMYIKNIKKPEI